jgi:hypothetical protein
VPDLLSSAQEHNVKRGVVLLDARHHDEARLILVRHYRPEYAPRISRA